MPRIADRRPLNLVITRVDSVGAGCAGRTGPARAAVAPQTGVAAGATITAVAPHDAGRPAGSASPPVAIEQPAIAACTSVGAGSAGPASAAVADQPGRTTVTARLAGSGTRTAVAAIAVQQSAVSTVLARPAVGAVSDQWPPQ
ncbi:hypothetical protein B1T47_22185 [Mycobacterium kansasii]|nr:hypothetical protein B1T47_22185 [Mycobacterium kansasii]